MRLKQGPYAALLNKRLSGPYQLTKPCNCTSRPVSLGEDDPHAESLPRSHRMIGISLKFMQRALKQDSYASKAYTVTALLFKCVFSETSPNGSFKTGINTPKSHLKVAQRFRFLQVQRYML